MKKPFDMPINGKSSVTFTCHIYADLLDLKNHVNCLWVVGPFTKCHWLVALNSDTVGLINSQVQTYCRQLSCKMFHQRSTFDKKNVQNCVMFYDLTFITSESTLIKIPFFGGSTKYVAVKMYIYINIFYCNRLSKIIMLKIYLTHMFMFLLPCHAMRGQIFNTYLNPLIPNLK